MPAATAAVDPVPVEPSTFTGMILQPQQTPAPAFEAPPAAAPPVTPEPAEADAPAEGKAHGLARAAGHSNRSDVAALRQWVNHPELRDSLELPDLTAEHNGNGFQKAVAAYEAAIAIANPAVTDTPPASETPPGSETPPAIDTPPASATPPATDTELDLLDVLPDSAPGTGV
jgi:hypothetical protein